MKSPILSALIVDDEPDARGVMRELIDLFCPEITKTVEAADTAMALHLVQAHSFQLAFIDIELGQESGLELAEAIFPYCQNIVFVTAHDNYAIQAFQTPAIHYLLKPVNPRYLRQAVSKAILENNTLGGEKRILIHSQEGIFIIKPAEIVHVDGQGNYSTFHLTNGEKILVSKHLAYYEELLDDATFFRIHQSHLVNLSQVKKINTQDGPTVIMNNESELPLARRRKEKFLNAL